MATSYLQDFSNRWQKRMSAYGAQGVGSDVLAPIMRMDAETVKRGGQPLGDPEATDLVRAQMHSTGMNIAEAQPKTGFMDILGNAGKDLTTVAKGLFHLPQSIVGDLSHIGQAPAAIGKVGSELGKGHWSEGLKDIAKIPGLYEAAMAADVLSGGAALPFTAPLFAAPTVGTALEGKKGLQEIAQHPLIHALNLLPLKDMPLGGEVELPTGKFKVDEAGIPTEITRQAKRTPQTAFQASGPGQDITAALRKRLQPSGRDAGTRDVAQALQAAKRERDINLQSVIQRLGKGGITEGENPELMRALHWRKVDQSGHIEVMNPDGSSVPLPPELAQMYGTAEAHVANLAQHPSNVEAMVGVPLRDDLSVVRPGEDFKPTDVVDFPLASPAARLLRAVRGHETRLVDQTADLTAATERVGAASKRMEKLADNGKAPTWDTHVPVAEQVMRTWNDDRTTSFEATASPADRARVTELRQHVLPQLVSALKNGEEPAALRLIDRARDMAARTPIGGDTATILDGLRERVSGYRERIKGYEEATATKAESTLRAAKLKDSADKTERAVNRVYNTLGQRLRTTQMPDVLRPAVGDVFRSQLLKAVGEEGFDGPKVAELQGQIGAGDFDPVKAAVGTEQWDGLLADSRKQIADLWSQGLRPLYVHNVSPDYGLHNIASPPLSAGIDSLSQAKSRTWDLTPKSSNVMVALTDQAMELVTQRIQRHFALEEVPKTGRVLSREGVRAAIARSYPTATPDQVAHMLRTDWETFTPTEFTNFGKVRTAMPTGGPEMLIERNLARNLRALTDPADAFPKWSNKALRVHYASVFFGPRHMAHVLFSSLGMMMAESGPAPLKFFREARGLMADAKAGNLSEEAMHRLAGIPRGGSMVDLDMVNHQLRAGVEMSKSAIGEAVQKSKGLMRPVDAAAKFMSRIEETTSDAFRAMEYLYAKDGGGLRGAERARFMQMTEEQRHQRGVEFASKVFVNFDRATATERKVVRSMFPFYAWTSHVMRQMFRLPMDHPIRVAAVTHFAANELSDSEKGLPLQWQSLLHIGKPNAKGSQTVIDGRSLNPFRDVGNYFTLAGVIAGLNPAFEGILGSLGVNVVSGAPSSFVEQTYDPVSGKLVGKRKNALRSTVESYVPQTLAAEKLVGLQGDRGDPASARQRLLSQSLNMPWTPYKVDPAKTKVQTEAARRKAAQVAIDSAFRDGNFDEALRYNLVPWRGQLVDPNKLKALYDRMVAANKTGLPVRAVMANQ